VTTEPSLLDLLNDAQELSASDHFTSEHLQRLFVHKIARSRATGKDGIRMSVFEDNLSDNLEVIQRKVPNGTYQFTNFKERLLLKGANNAPRQISIPTIRDRLVLRAVCQILHQQVPTSTGYSPHAVIDRVIRAIRTGSSDRSLIRIDVENFFPSVKHDRLSQELELHGVDELTRELCMKAVSTPTGSSENTADRGIPQGLSISGALACIYMLRFDTRQTRRFVQYFRYVDDILVIAETPKAESTLKSIRRAMARMGLRAHPKGTSGKTEIRSIKDGIDYLGYHITTDGVSVRETSFRRMFKNILKVVTEYRYGKDTERLIFRLNLKISGCLVDGKRRGWTMFFSRTEDINQLAHLDRFVRQQLRRVNFPAVLEHRIKRFVKSYHEIGFNLDQTAYVPNFEEFSLMQKTEVVATLSGKALEEVQAFDVELIEREFSRLLGQEIQDLEQDVGNPS
jgi:retron-type reverse transcriptase